MQKVLAETSADVEEVVIEKERSAQRCVFFLFSPLPDASNSPCFFLILKGQSLELVGSISELSEERLSGIFFP